MIRNYLKIAWKNLKRNKIVSFINIAGLAVGLAAAIIIFLWIQYELSYDTFHQSRPILYKVLQNQKYETGSIYTFSSVPAPLAKTLVSDFPEVKHATRVSWGNVHLFSYGDKHIEEYGYYVDPDFLKMFTFPLVSGKLEDQLQQPNTLVISETLADKYFGDHNPIGKIIRIDEDRHYKVTGVVKDVPFNSTLRFDYLMPAIDYIRLYMNNEEVWDNNNIQTYVQLNEGVRAANLNAKIEGILASKHKDQVNTKLFLHPAQDWYLRAQFNDGKNEGGQITYVRLFTVVAIFVLIIACINFMNLSTAQAAHRGKEVGVRKVIGGSRSSLIGQFLVESVSMALLAGLLALLMVQLVLPYVNTLLEKQLTFQILKPDYIPAFLALIILTGLVAGSYPSFVLSSFQPIQVLKGIAEGIKGKNTIRRTLVVLQFVISVVLIIGTIVIYQQIQYTQKKNLGYKKENLIYFSSAGINPSQYESFKQQLLKVEGVKSVTRSSINFTGSNNSTSLVNWSGKRREKEVLFSLINTDYDMLPTLGIELKEGRNFSREYGMDSSNVIINEEAVRRMSLQYPVAGQQIEISERKGTIIGVAKDFHISSIHGAIEPVILRPRSWTWTHFVRVDGSIIPQVLKEIEATYRAVVPNRPFSYRFMDDEYAAMYKSELQIGVLSTWFSALAIFISSLGLFGLISMAAVQRTKEIGIRKVLGASVTNLVSLLSKDFLKLVLIASVIAFPLAWWLMNKWLENFVYHIEISWWIFAIAGLSALIITIITVSFRAMKAALANPVKNLRTE